MYIKKIIALSGLTMLALLSFNASAKTSPHTWHTVRSGDGIWEARLQMINEGGFFESRDGSRLTTFVISPDKSQDYGFSFDPDADFNIAYTLTLTQKSTGKPLRFSSKACVYVITAAGPANPDIRPVSFHGATCDFKIMRGVGEDFWVS